MPSLSNERIRTLFSAFRAHDPYEEWRKQYRGALARIQGYDRRALRTAEAQEDLWSARDLATIGPGDAVDVRPAFTDPKVITAVIAIRERPLPGNLDDRAAAVQTAYTSLIELVYPRLAKKRPWARLSRLFAALLPRDLHCCFTSASRASVGLLLLDERDDSVGSAVLARARLREALEDEQSLDDDVWRSVFCWWLHENVAALRRGDEPLPIKTAVSTPASEAPRPEPLVIAPAHRLRRGIFAIKGLMSMTRLIVETAEGGASLDDIIESLLDIQGDDNLDLRTARRCVNRVRLLGIIENRGGLFHPSEVGKRLLNDPRPDSVVEHLLTTTFGLAHYIRYLAGGPLPRVDPLSKLQAIHPTWTTKRMPASIAAWARSLGLVRTHEGKAELTEYGEEWESRLPEELKIPPHRELEDDESDAEDDDEPAGLSHPGTGRGPGALRLSSGAPRGLPPPPTLEAIGKTIAEAEPDFVVRPELLRALHLAWHSIPTKRFVIFSGLSGTGKTALLNLYASAYCKLMGLDIQEHRTVAAVAPDWRDPSSLLGLKQALTKFRVAPLASPPTQYAAPRVLALLRSNSASRTRGLRDLEQLLALKSA